MKAILVKALADLRRRRLQAAVIFLTVLLAVGTGTMALTLVTQTHDPYETAFAAQKGAHLQVYYVGETDRQALVSTPSLIGASAYGGPYPSTSVEFQHRSRKFSLDTYGRDNPGGDVEVLRITSGHWPSSDSEIVLTRSFAELKPHLRRRPGKGRQRRAETHPHGGRRSRRHRRRKRRPERPARMGVELRDPGPHPVDSALVLLQDGLPLRH